MEGWVVVVASMDVVVDRVRGDVKGLHEDPLENST